MEVHHKAALAVLAGLLLLALAWTSVITVMLVIGWCLGWALDEWLERRRMDDGW